MADVLIKGMEMPTNCQHCLFSDYESRYCKAANEYIPMLGHPRFCPLVEVPTHGRLIDADELLKRKGDCYDHEGHLLYAVGTGDIMLAPTVIEASEEE